MTDTAISKLTVEPELALEFLAAFSRLEYALKVTQFRKTGEGEAKADWSKFSLEVSRLFDPNKSEALSNAFAYTTTEPLRFLGVKNGVLDWYDFSVPQNCHPVDKAIRIIKQVRNNLFHGGKYAKDNKAAVGRDSKLLKSALLVLNELRQVIPDVQSVYDY